MSQPTAQPKNGLPCDEAGVPDFLRDGGEMGTLMRGLDWSGTALGPPRLWPQSLRTVVRLMLNTGHPMYIWWGAQRACLYNDAYRHSIGPERHPGSLGRPAREVWEEIWDIINPQIEQVMSGGGATWHVNQLVPITRHGKLEEVYWTYSYSPIDDESAPGGIGGVLVVCSETTEQVLAEKLLREADRKKDRFIAVLAHELRNPLAAISNAVEVLRRSGPAAPDAGWCHDIIARQVQQMTHLLDDLLDASRLSRGQLRLRPQMLALATVIEHAMEIAAPHVEAGDHTLHLSMPQQALELEGDLTRLAQVFSNILINAAKYTAPRGTLWLSAARDGAQAVVTVTDSGIGIEAPHIPTIFEMFGQVESASNRSQGGQGIGLALAKGLVEMHGGSIRAYSEGLGHGSSFEVRLPLLLEQRQTSPSASSAPAPSVPQDARHVLIVDDLRDAADSLAEALRIEGHSVDVAYEGEQALRLAETRRPEVVLLDLGMPKMDGFEVCRRLRATDWGSALLLIAQTGWGQQLDRERTREAGFDHHVVKPVALADVLALLRRP